MHIRFSLPFLGPSNYRAFVFSSISCLQLQLAVSLALKQHFNRLTGVDSAQFGVVLKNLCRNFSCDLVFLCKVLLTNGGRRIPFVLILSGFETLSLALAVAHR